MSELKRISKTMMSHTVYKVLGINQKSLENPETELNLDRNQKRNSNMRILCSSHSFVDEFPKFKLVLKEVTELGSHRMTLLWS